VKAIFSMIVFLHKPFNRLISSAFVLGPLKRVSFVMTGVLAVSLLALGPSGVLKAETLNKALGSAYDYNPTLRAERARLRATDEGVAQARAGYRPNVFVDGQVGTQDTTTRPRSLTDGRVSPTDGRVSPYGYSVTLSQPLFRGGRTVNGIRQAKSNVLAGRANLRNVEQTVLLDAVASFMNVVREVAVLRLRQNNLSVLTRQLKATQDRFSVGEVTTTDVAQARARRSAAVSAVNLARANLKTARAEYQRIVGHRPGRLGRPGTIRKYLPRSQSEAIDWGLAENPAIESAVFLEKAARQNVRVIEGERLPEVSLEAQYSQNFDSSPFTDERNVGSITARARVPLYQGGAVYSRIRQAKQVVLQRRAELTQARVQVRSSVISAYGQLEAARAQIEANQVAVRANRTALSGVREEEKVGQRTVLDVLDAEQDFLDSQVNLVTSQRDVVVAEYNLLVAMGRLSVATLPVSTVIYDPVENFSRVDRKWRGGDINDPELDRRGTFLTEGVFDRRSSLK
jgi:outer membrane protein